MSTFASVSKQVGKIKPETKAIAQEVYEAAKKAGHEIWYIWGMGTSDEHKTGLALDLMVKSEATGDWVRNYLWNNRARLRLRHVIWEQHITSTVTQPGVRRKMGDRGNPTANHYDHIHVWFFAGSYRKPTTATPAPPKPSAPTQLAVTGKLDAATIRRWQQVMGTPVDGKITEKSSLVKAVQTKLKATVDHRLVVDGDGDSLDADVFRKTVAALQRYLKSPVDGVISTPKSQVIVALQRRLNTGKF